jgi:hypothetical protein
MKRLPGVALPRPFGHIEGTIAFPTIEAFKVAIRKGSFASKPVKLIGF